MEAVAYRTKEEKQASYVIAAVRAKIHERTKQSLRSSPNDHT